MKNILLIGSLLLLGLLVSGCTTPGSFGSDITKEELFDFKGCNWNAGRTMLTCSKTDLRQTTPGPDGFWIADTGVLKGAESVKTEGRLEYCDGYKEYKYVNPRSGISCCRWDPDADMGCWLDDGTVGVVVADNLETRCSRVIGCKFTERPTPLAGTLIVDLAGTSEPPPGGGYPPEPEIPVVVWESLISIFQDLWNWLTGLFSQAAIQGG